MNTWKKILQWLNNPRWWFLLPVMLIAIGTTVGGTLILTQDYLFNYLILGYVLLGIAGITLSYSIFGVIRIYPKVKENILKWAEKHPRINKLFNYYGFTTLWATAVSLIISIAFAAYNGAIATGIMCSADVPHTLSIWFWALTTYYVVLVALRSSVLVHHGKSRKTVLNGQSETQTIINDGKMYRNCGIMLCLLPVCLSFAILQMVREGTAFEHSGIMIYVYAIYAFFKIITAIYSFIKEFNNHSMTIMATKNIKLADAMVSILALQTAMFHEFGDIGINTAIMNAITGAVVCALTLAMGVYMIVRATLRIKRLKQE